MKEPGQHWSYRLAEFANQYLSWLPLGCIPVLLIFVIGGVGIAVIVR